MSRISTSNHMPINSSLELFLCRPRGSSTAVCLAFILQPLQMLYLKYQEYLLYSEWALANITPHISITLKPLELRSSLIPSTALNSSQPEIFLKNNSDHISLFCSKPFSYPTFFLRINFRLFGMIFNTLHNLPPKDHCNLFFKATFQLILWALITFVHP